jgi:1-acyl-sn-glycerol-3-phosphate acyltransferase
LKTLWWYFVKYLVKSSLFFYSKRIKVSGKQHIPKKGAVLFMVNHPNGLIDPLIVAVNNPRILHFLVQAAAFKNPTVKKFLGTLNLMPIYRMRDGVRELGRNQQVFENCFSIFKKHGALMIFPEGTHDRRRTVRHLSKGFSRIVFGAIEQYPELEIQIVPVGITYQNASVFPAKISLQYGKPILANEYLDTENQNAKTKELKDLISDRLKELCVHIPADENYESTLQNLNQQNVDFTKVSAVNHMIKTGTVSGRKRRIYVLVFLKPLIILNSLVPWLLWKSVDKKNDEPEFVDTYRFGFNTVTFPLFYVLQSLLVAFLFNWSVAGIYFGISLFIVLIYSKLHPVPAEKIRE